MQPCHDRVRYLRVTADWSRQLAEFFSALAAEACAIWFHPHPLTAAAAEAVSRHDGKDLYVIQTADNQLSGYGMLRGWDAGFDDPSLGLAIHPDFRGKKLGLAFMRFLHERAAAAGAGRIRIKVYADNHPAITMYRKLGYVFSGREGAQRIGWLRVSAAGPSVPDAVGDHLDDFTGADR